MECELNTKLNVLILDDDTSRAEGWRDTMVGYGGLEIHVPPKEDVSKIIGGLHTSRLQSREDRYLPFAGLDSYDLVIIDYDLLGLETDGRSAWSTGAEVAYAARLMCDVGPIVVVNQFGTNSFDLTMRRTIISYADFDVGNEQISENSLWMSSGFKDFRPWHWPDLRKETNRFKEMHQFVLDHIDQPMMQALGFELYDVLSPRFIGHDVVGVLGVKGAENVTFRQLVTERRDIKVFNILEKDLAIIRNMNDSQVARLSSVITWHWLEKVVLQSQEVLSDLPHIASKMPWVINEYSNLTAWDELCSMESPKGVIDELQGFRFEPSCMLTRPAYWVGDASAKIMVPKTFEVSKLPDLAFCEDSSSFLKKDDAVSFPSDLFSFDKERWVKGDLNCGDTTVNYEPQAYLLM